MFNSLLRWIIRFQNLLVNPLHLYINKESEIYDTREQVESFLSADLLLCTEQMSSRHAGTNPHTHVRTSLSVRRLLAELTDGWEVPWKWVLHSTHTESCRVRCWEVAGFLSPPFHWSTVISLFGRYVWVTTINQSGSLKLCRADK